VRIAAPARRTAVATALIALIWFPFEDVSNTYLSIIARIRTSGPPENQAQLRPVARMERPIIPVRSVGSVASAAPDCTEFGPADGTYTCSPMD